MPPPLFPGWAASRRALGRFVLLLAGAMTLLFLALSLGPVHAWLTGKVYSLVPEVAAATRLPLLLMCLWPAVIAWRRIYQGRLIVRGRGKIYGRGLALSRRRLRRHPAGRFALGVGGRQSGRSGVDGGAGDGSTATGG